MEKEVTTGTPIAMKILMALSCSIILFWPFSLYFSIFLFDAPDSSSKVSTWLTAIAFWTYPVIVVAIVYAGQKIYKTNGGLGAVIVGIPLVIALAFFVSIYQVNENSTWGFASYANAKEVDLVKAVIDGDLDSIEYLVTEKQVNVNAENDRGDSPLVAAYEANQFDSFKKLLTLGADPNHLPKNRVRKSAAGMVITELNPQRAAQNKHYLVTLFNHGLNPHLADKVESLFHLSVTSDIETVRKFLSYGVDYNLKLKWGTPLEYAVLEENWDIVIELLELPEIEVTQESIERFNRGKRGFDGKLLNNNSFRMQVLNIFKDKFGIPEEKLAKN